MKSREGSDGREVMTSDIARTRLVRSQRRMRLLGWCLSVFLTSACAAQDSVESQQLLHSAHTVTDAPGQTFVATHDYLSVIDIQAAGEAPPLGPDSRVFFELWKVGDSPTLVRKAAIPAEAFRRAQFTRVSFPPIADSEGQPFAFTISVMGVSELQLWCTSWNSYGGGQQTVNGVPVAGDLTFRALYRLPPWQIARDGWKSTLNNWRVVFAASVSFGIGGLFAAGLLRRLIQLDATTLCSMGCGAGPLLIVLLASGMTLIGLRITGGAAVSTLAALGLASMWLWRSKPALDRQSWLTLGIFSLAVLGIGLLRMAFARDLPAPAYVDSVQHFVIARDLQSAPGLPSHFHTLVDPAARYYHFGFHALVVWMAAVAGLDLLTVIAVLGQLIQVVAVAAIYFPLRVISGDAWVGVAGLAFVALGWMMPGYASNWGKFPAVLAVATTPTVIGLAVVACQASGFQRLQLLGAAALAAVSATLAHLRALVILGSSLVLAGFLAFTWRGRRLPTTVITLSCALVVLGGLVMWMLRAGDTSTSPSLAGPLLTWARYSQPHGLITSAIVGLMCPLAWLTNKRLTLIGLLSVAVTMLLMLGPVPGLFTLYIFDRPFGELVMYLPLTLLGSLGVGGCFQFASRPNLQPAVRWLARTAGAGALVLIGWNGLSRQAFTPSSCCQMIGPDDLQAITWARTALPSEGLTLVAAVAWSPELWVGLDGGAWFEALSGRRTVLWRGDAELSQASVHKNLCAAGVTNIYVGAQPDSFRRQHLDAAPQFYEPGFVLPKAQIYHVRNCAVTQ